LPRKEDYGFTSQIRRSVLCISANIAEAYGRNHTADKVNFYYFARGSVKETQSHLEYGKRVGYFDNKVAEELVEMAYNSCKNVEASAIMMRLKRKIKRKETEAHEKNTTKQKNSQGDQKYSGGRDNGEGGFE